MSIVVRRLRQSEMPAAARVHRASFDERLPWLAGLHTPEEDRRYWSDHLFPSCEIWGAEKGSGLLGVIAFRKDWVDQLYLLPGAQGEGIGSKLLEVARNAHPQLFLWTFQRNLAARRFYERHGFQSIRETDGADNEEREPDVLYRWMRSE
ncbi:GNAT family N-acetyltransferase [Rhizobium sp. LC145]|uniref:GNAT family N-acetyltransferase n=1 Tax=Rhizobium sp. LC145 TaxID=1120688 RepID=UPI000629F560|nr:GNAT family N-acetyltransferase [Rhizobium sp. LC145]KKX34022.1 acetyltransferase [Rhizobium sp. LC145]TKT67010.1 GNAT family N-acetyltransferase [Rhizobiaceae bacterium LC148]